MKDKEAKKELYEKFTLIAEKYLPLQDEKKGNFIAVIPKSPAELIREGEMLHHCVGKMGYDQKFIREETLIFFIRNKAQPNTPFVTVEYSLKKKQILQCHGSYNSKPDEAVMYYINTVWLSYANKKLKKISA